MIENNPINVASASQMLLEEVETEIGFVNGVGAKAFEGRDYDRAKEALEQAGTIVASVCPVSSSDSCRSSPTALPKRV